VRTKKFWKFFFFWNFSDYLSAPNGERDVRLKKEKKKNKKKKKKVTLMVANKNKKCFDFVYLFGHQVKIFYKKDDI